MNKYELVFVISTVLDEEATEAIIAKFEGIIKNNGGEIEKNDRWGKRRLAYEIKNQSEGYYCLVTFSSQPKVVDELDRVLKITEEVLRHMIVRLDD